MQESENYDFQKIADLLESEIRDERILGRVMLEHLDKCEPVLDLMETSVDYCLLWVWFYGMPVTFGDYRTYISFYKDNRYRPTVFKRLKLVNSKGYGGMFIEKWDLHEDTTYKTARKNSRIVIR